MAIGAGNLWRFPRLAGQYGGTFILLWILFLFVWSIPLLLAEFSIGKKCRQGVIGSYAELTGKRYTFLGFFITACTLGIAFYYAVVTAWALRYLGFSLQNLLPTSAVSSDTLHQTDYLLRHWEQISNGSMLTWMLFVLVLIVGVFILSKGISNGLEKANRILIPSLFVLLLIVCVVSLSMANGVKGLEYMFLIKPSLFYEPKVWIEALSQSAWSTGAGWGLLMTLSSYSRDNDDVVLNTFIGAFGNNTASILAGVAILPAVFALSATEAGAIEYLQSGNQALTFTIIPKLFSAVPGGNFLSVIFFLALFLAAFSSLLPMIELMMSHVIKLGMSRSRAIAIILICFVVVGSPSSLSLDFFSNQDWVWGVGLVVSGMCIAFAVVVYGPARFKTDLIDQGAEMRISSAFFKYSIYSIVVLGVVLIYWWLSRGYSEYPWFDENGTWNLTDVYSNASVVTQWGAVFVLGLFLNRVLYQKYVNKVQ